MMHLPRQFQEPVSGMPGWSISGPASTPTPIVSMRKPLGDFAAAATPSSARPQRRVLDLSFA
jgi:hypothetical protein